jgi:curved DNA-binding protein CbpA
MGTHYESLKVTEDAPPEVIRAAYRALSLKYHPDRTNGNPQALRQMQRINEAHDVLSDRWKRDAYDGELNRHRNPGASVRRGSPKPVRHEVRFSSPRPAWMKSSFLFLSDARFVIPVVILIWWIVFRLLART